MMCATYKRKVKIIHFVLSWDIHTKNRNGNTEDREWGEVNSRLQECIEPYSWVRPLSTFYIVRVSGPQEWQEIRDALVRVAENSTADINFLIGPLMSGGQYDGWLPEDIWPKVQKRTA